MPDVGPEAVQVARGGFRVVFGEQVVATKLLPDDAEIAVHEGTAVGPLVTVEQVVAR